MIFKTQSLLLLIEKEELNQKFFWIKYDKFKYYLNIIANNINIENLDGESDKLFKLIGEDIIDSEEEKPEENINEIIKNDENENSMEGDDLKSINLK